MSLSALRIVMLHTSHPGNIGACARAMKTMGLSDLVLVQPNAFPHEEADARAKGAVDILHNARVCADLEQAIADCTLVFGASARLRSLTWPVVNPRQCAEQAVAAAQTGQRVALLFGNEQSGLSNEELDRCHSLVHIPTNPNYSSLNIAAAIQVLAYELRMAHIGGEIVSASAEEVAATQEEMEGFYRHLEQTLVAIDYLDPATPRQLMRRLRRLFNRAQLDKMEVNILRGILKAVLKLRRNHTTNPTE